MNLLYSLSLLAAFTSQASAFAPISLASQRSNVFPTLIMSTVDTFTLPTVKNVKEEFKTSEFNTMLQWSALLYSYTRVRDIIKEYSAVLNPDKEDSVTFNSPELVITQQYEEDTNPFDGTYLKTPITPTNILKFIRLNQKYFVGDDGALEFNPAGDGNADVDGDGVGDLPIMKRLRQVDDEFDAQIIEYDDEFISEGIVGLGSELVFSIILNKTEKRITVVFRGSVSVKDWIKDLSFIKTNPDPINEFAGDKVGIHTGFSDYLFGESNEEDNNKFDQILYILNQVSEQYPEFSIYVTGHSLGGALTQLLAYALAGSPKAEDLPKPINAISYASPRVGDENYLKSYQDLEKKGKVRHIRISNQGDLIPAAPSVGYYQTGLNLHVRDNKKMQVGYSKDRGIFGQFSPNSLDMHNLDYYHERLFTDENSVDIRLSIDELYEKHADISLL